MTDSPSLEIGNSRDFGEIREQVHRIVREIAPGHDLTHIDQAFRLIESGCTGALAGYERLQTPYHDQGHILEVVLCSARYAPMPHPCAGTRAAIISLPSGAVSHPSVGRS